MLPYLGSRLAVLGSLLVLAVVAVCSRSDAGGTRGGTGSGGATIPKTDGGVSPASNGGVSGSTPDITHPDAASADDASGGASGASDAGGKSSIGGASDAGGPTSDAETARIPGDRWVRVKALGPDSKWNLPGYTPAQVIALITKLQPDFLDRLTDGPQDPNALLNTSGPTVGTFLQRALNAARPGATFSSRVDLVAYDNDPASWMLMTKALLNLPVTPRPYALSVDDWVLWLNNGHTPAEGEAIIRALHAQGWHMVQVTQCGVFDMNGYGDYTETCVHDTSGWAPSASLLTTLAQHYQQIQLYMDFPSPMAQYCALSADQQQSIVDNIAAKQSTWGVTYVFPFLEQGGIGNGNTCYFDSSKIALAGGGTLLDHQLALMTKYNP